jgi:hypothetical protein
MKEAVFSLLLIILALIVQKYKYLHLRHRESEKEERKRAAIPALFVALGDQAQYAAFPARI